MKSAKLCSIMIDMLLDYLELEQEILVKEDCDINLLGYYKMTREYIEGKLAEELSLMLRKLEFDLKKVKEERGFPKQAYDTISTIIQISKEDAK